MAIHKRSKLPTYIYDREGWPEFTWDPERLSIQLAEVRHRQGRFIGRMEALGFALRSEAGLQTLTEEAVKSSEIEGERLDRQQVRSSLAKRLGMDVAGLVRASRNIEGIAEMVVDATQKFMEPLTQERLFAWHAALFPTGRSHMSEIRVGNWRDDEEGPMQVVSGPMNKVQVHFQAPEAQRLSREMRSLLAWFNGKSAASPMLDPVLKSAIAHLWFVTLHPFDDGNGRIARAISDLALARADRIPQRFYSLSAQICAERKDYYSILETTQKGGLDITPWLEWFLGCLGRAIDGSEAVLATVLVKARFWEARSSEAFNERQRKLLNRLLDGAHGGFDGKLTSSKWAAIGKCSQDTASRDIEDLVRRGILSRNSGGGRSTSYSLAE
jgi:Fic family protein